MGTGSNFSSKRRKSCTPKNSNNDDSEDSEKQNLKAKPTIRLQKGNVDYQASNQLKELMTEKMANRVKNLTITDLQKKLPKTGSYEMRTAYMKKFIEQLEKDHSGYFNGKKVPYSKNQSYKQCILNPYTNDGSVITV